MTRLFYFSFAIPLLTLLACTQSDTKNIDNGIIKNGSDSNKVFENAIVQFLNEYWQLYPTAALYSGLYDFDNQLVVPNEQNRTRRREFNQQWLETFNAFDDSQLNQNNKTDRLILVNRIRFSIWNSGTLKGWQWDPSNYNVGGGFGLILNTDYKPLAQRLETFYQRMAFVPAYYQAAQRNISEPTLPHLELAIQQNQGALSLFNQRFIAASGKVDLNSDTSQAYRQRAAETAAAIEQHIAFLQNLKSNLQGSESKQQFRSFRLGKTLFQEKFTRQIVTDFSAEELYQLATNKKQVLHNEMYSITRQLWPKYFRQQAIPQEPLTAIGMMIEKVSLNHANREDFVDEVRRQITQLEAFVRDKDLLDLDPTRPLVVREMPEYEQGFAVASIDAPGPFDAKANTYYNVSPLTNYDSAGAESFLREYNNYTLQILNIHEAIPGHYAQLVHSNNAQSLVKSLFGNGAMVEGWAVYTEHMMLEAGYGNGEPELRLMYNKWLLRTVINAIIDHDIHCKGMSEQQALAMMMNEGFQEEAEATGKWRRATLSQVQLSSYFTGFSEILAFREEQKAKLGDQFDLKNFHHQFLSYGSAPVPIIKSLFQDTKTMN